MRLDTHLRVLLVEDNALDARIVTRALATSTDVLYEVIHVGDLQTALHQASNEVFDCVLLDLSLPDSEGLVPVESLSVRAPHCPVVVLTGLDDPDVAVEAMKRGAQDYLIKSTMTSELVERAIRYAVARHHSEVQLQSAKDLIETMNDHERIARDLHDTVIQRLFATGMGLQLGSSADEPEDLRARALAAVDEIDEAIRELRAAIFGLNTFNGDISLAADISRTVAAERDVLGFMPDVRIGVINSLDGDIHHAIISVVREALTNVARHAAASAVEVTVQIEDDDLVVRVIDNGKGVGADDASATRSDDPIRSGYGLANLRIRAADLGGRFKVGPGLAGGCCLEWAVPLS